MRASINQLLDATVIDLVFAILLAIREITFAVNAEDRLFAQLLSICTSIYRSSGFPVPLPLTGVSCAPSVKVIKKQVHYGSALSVRNYSWNDLNH